VSDLPDVRLIESTTKVATNLTTYVGRIGQHNAVTVVHDEGEVKLGTTGFNYAGAVRYRPDEVILEVGSGESTFHLAEVGSPVVTIDVNAVTANWVSTLDNVEVRHGRAEDVLRDWNRPIGFAWLDGHDWPYTGNLPGYYHDQRVHYESTGLPYSQDASRRSHLAVARLIVDHARVIAFDDTWRTHAYRATDDGCGEPVPPATTPAPALAMNEPINRSTCGLTADHPHHDDPDRGWNGKGGTAIPYLLERGFEVVEYGLGLVVLRRTEDGAT